MFGQLKIFAVQLNAHGIIANSFGSSDGRTRPHEWVEYRAFSKRKQCTDDDANEMLGFEARVVGNGFLAVGRAPAWNRIGQRLVHRKPAKAAGLPLAKILSDCFRPDGLSKKHPGFVSALGCDADFGEFSFRVLRAVSTTETEIKPHDGSPHFVARFDHRSLNQVLCHLSLSFSRAVHNC